MGIELTNQNKSITLKQEDNNIALKQALKGDKGEPFRYEDFTPEQLEALKGEPGEPGYSPRVNSVKTTDGYLITIKTIDGNNNIMLFNGEDGEKGDTGANGYSPTISFEPLDNDAGYLYTITDITGKKQHFLFNGAKGEPGYSPTITTRAVDGGTNLYINDINGSKNVLIKVGVDGISKLELKSQYYNTDWYDGMAVSQAFGSYDFHFLTFAEPPQNILIVDIGIWYKDDYYGEPKEYRGIELYENGLLSHGCAYITIYPQPRYFEGWGGWEVASGFDDANGKLWEDYVYCVNAITGFTIYYLEVEEQ